MEADEMELSLELSIGGCYKHMEKARNYENEIDENNISSRSLVSESCVVGYVQDEIFSSGSVDLGKKREIQALRRREAIKKREEKQKRWARSRGVNEKIYLEMQQTQARAVDRGRREHESSEEFLMKRAKGNGANTNMNGAGSRSTDAGSHSNNSQAGRQQLSTTAASTTSEGSDLNDPSSLMQSDQANRNAVHLLLTVSSADIPTPQCSNSQKCEPIDKLMPTPKEQASSTSRQCEEALVKPSMPQNNNQDTSRLPRMTLVSTTGNGPNGKTVNGFLYSYSKSEVNMVCVCHGSLFSPAKFVEHAGGIDISHPLKHITVVPTPFG